jgi:probable rRNA maturation factor
VSFDRGAAGIVIADDETVWALNRTHRGLDETTDVLAFSNISEGRYYGDDSLRPFEEDGGFPAPPDQGTEFGEVVISYPQVLRQASEAGHSVEKELATLLAHGLLHLLGYDHEDPEEEAEMAARQEAVLVEVLED